MAASFESIKAEMRSEAVNSLHYVLNDLKGGKNAYVDKVVLGCLINESMEGMTGNPDVDHTSKETIKCGIATFNTFTRSTVNNYWDA